MKLKGWMLRKVNGVGTPRGRASSHSRARRWRRAARARCSPMRVNARAAYGQRGAVPDDVENLGPYRALIGAIREELEHFVTTQLRLHLAIAERDRYVLASIEVECDESGEHRELLRRFISEFKPEQIKHYLAKEVIAGLRNASAIDLSQFAGLNAAQQEAGVDEEAERYGELLAELRRGSTQSAARPYRVTLLGRWSQLDVPAPASERGSPRTTKRADADFPASVRDRYRGCGRRSPRRAHLRRARASLCCRQGRGLRYRCRWGLCQPAALRDVARQRCLVGRRRRVDQRDSRRVGEQPDRAMSSGRARVARRRRSSLHTGAWLVLSEHTEGPPGQYPRIVAASDRWSPKAAPKPPRAVSPNTGNADCSTAPPRGSIDHHRPHGVGRSRRRHSR